MDTLGKIFGNPARVKIMRLFLFHPGENFDIQDISSRSKVSKASVRKEMNQLKKVGFVKPKSYTETQTIKTAKQSKKGTATKKKVKKQGYRLNPKFELIDPLQRLLIETELIKEQDILKELRKAGKLKLVLLSGLFLGDDNAELDMLIVGNKLRDHNIAKAVNTIESQIGKEIRYTYFNEEEFNYRMSMYDKLLRTLINGKHACLLDSVGYQDQNFS